MNINAIYPRRFAVGEDIHGQTPTLAIRSVTMEKVGPVQKPVVWFDGARKGVIMGPALARQIAAVCGEETDDWSGKVVQLYTLPCRVNGEARIRICARTPRELLYGTRAAHVDRETGELVYEEVPT